MRGEDHSYPSVQLAASNFSKGKLYQRYFAVTYLKLLTTSILPVDKRILLVYFFAFLALIRLYVHV